MLREIDGVRLNVLDEGTGPAVVFLHGLGGCWRDWEPQVESFRPDFRVVVIEHRGHGRSDRVPGPYSTDLFAADARAVCRDLGIDHAYVVGLSMGGMIAHKLAVAAPDLVDALVLCDTFWKSGTGGREGMRIAAEVVRSGGMGGLTALLGAGADEVVDAAVAGMSVAQRNNLRDASGNDPHCWAWAAEAVCDHDMTDDKGDVACPTLVLWGADDTTVNPKLAQPLADAVRADRCLVIEGAGHVCNIDRPEVFDAEVRRFFADHPPPR